MNTIVTVLERFRTESFFENSTQLIEPVVGQVVAQGDLNFLVLAKLPKGVVSAPSVAQLVTGTTKGSRHCIASHCLKEVEFFAYPDPNPLEGGILKFNGEVEIEHPEHGNQIWPNGTIVAIGYQRKHADEIRRVQD